MLVAARESPGFPQRGIADERAGVRPKARHVAYWLEGAWLARRMERLGIEHLHAHFGTNPAAVAVLVGAWGARRSASRCMGRMSSMRRYRLALGAKVKAASFVVAISSYCRSQLMRWSEQRDWRKIRVVRCGLDRAFLDAPPWPVPNGSTELLCVARLSAQKGLPLLLEACDRLRAAGQQFTLTIIGDGELRDSLQAEIERRALGDCVTLAGAASSAEIREALARARAFVLPSFAEGLPVVLMEALAMSRPVIATAELAEELQRTPGLTLRPTVGSAPYYHVFPEQWDAKSPVV